MNGAHPPADGFKNYFGPRAEHYAEWRPRYPAAMLDYLARVSGGTELVWDCGTGNGQAAIGLAVRFRRVVATDASADMIAHAIPHARVSYRVARYESQLPDRSANLVTVAQALHWFDVDSFLREARRVLVPNGVLAAWCYALCRMEPEQDDVIARFARETLESFWPPERRYIDAEYRPFVLPLDEWTAPAFDMSESWTLFDFVHHVRTWSGTNRCIAARGEAPVLEFERSLAARWGDPALRRRVRWPIHMRIGRFR